MSSDSMMPRARDEALLEHVTDALLVLSNVGFGDYSSRLTIPDDSTDSLQMLFEGINEMIISLEDEKKRGDEYRRELEEKLAMIEQQKLAIRELSTPIMEVWDGVLCLPVVGVMDTVRSAEMTNSLLHSVVEKKARCCIIDITGIEVMDTGTADHFMRMARAVGLLGSRCVLTGINPHIAQTIVHMGVDLSGIETHRSLREALQRYVIKGKTA